jgi:predicted nicotinamide N-methyase
MMHSGPIRNVSHITVPLGNDIEIAIKQEKSLGSTTGWLIWPISTHLCKFIIHNASLIENKNILELGSGTGIVGIACNIAGAAVTVLTDTEEGIPICLENVRHNAHLLRSNSELAVQELFWGNLDHISEALRKFEKIDVLLGSDIIYHQSMVALASLVDSIKLLSSRGTIFILAYESRMYD